MFNWILFCRFRDEGSSRMTTAAAAAIKIPYLLRFELCMHRAIVIYFFTFAASVDRPIYSQPRAGAF